MRNKSGISDNQPENQLLANIIHFGRILRGLGLPISNQQISGLAQGIAHINISRRDDFYYTSRAFLLHDESKAELFNQAFDLFWTQQISTMLELMAERSRLETKKETREPVENEGNISSSNVPGIIKDHEHQSADDAAETKTAAIYSPIEDLYRKDFSDLDESELLEAIKVIEKIVWEIGQKRSRRRIRAFKHNSYMDFRRTIRNKVASGGEILKFRWHKKKLKSRPLVVICDISGSMNSYSKIFLSLIYGLAQNTKRIESFVFGTRLTRITHALFQQDLDDLFKELSNLIFDWSTGTRIGESIRDFNFNWSRRILGRGAVVVIISDGWDRGDLDLLGVEIRRLARSADRLIWVNPLAGSAHYKPLVGGIKTILPHVDDFLPLNNLDSLERIANKLQALI